MKTIALVRYKKHSEVGLDGIWTLGSKIHYAIFQVRIDDNFYKYVLLCNKGNLEDNLTATKWIAPIKWKAIFSYDPNYSEKESLYSQLLESNELLRWEH